MELDYDNRRLGLFNLIILQARNRSKKGLPIWRRYDCAGYRNRQQPQSHSSVSHFATSVVILQDVAALLPQVTFASTYASCSTLWSY